MVCLVFREGVDKSQKDETVDENCLSKFVCNLGQILAPLNCFSLPLLGHFVTAHYFHGLIVQSQLGGYSSCINYIAISHDKVS